MRTSSDSSTRSAKSSAPAVLDLATRLTMSEDASEAADVVVEFAMEFFDAERVSVGILDEDDPQSIEIVAVRGPNGVLPRGELLDVSQMALSEAIATRESLVFNPASRTEKDARALYQMGVRSCLIIPLLSAGRVLGTLNIGMDDPQVDLDAAHQLARLLGSQLDRITTRVRLERQLSSNRSESRRWELLRGLEQWALSATSVDELITDVAAMIAELIDGAYLCFVEMRTGSALVRSSDGERGEFSIAMDDPRHASMLERFGTEAAHYIPDLAADSVEPYVPEVLAQGAKSVLCVSVAGRTGPFGALIVSSTTVDGIHPRDRDLLNAIAPMLGGALERLEIDERLARSVTHDQLTGLIRRSGFDAIVDEEIGSLRGTELASAVVALDVDRFKVVNDTEGHLRGDDFLVELVARVGRVLEPQDVATRVGADEFVILLRGRDREEYENVCGRIVTAVNSDPFFVRDRPLFGTVSLGFVVLDGLTESARDAMSMADAACYSAKMAGGNQVRPALAHDSRQSARRTASRSLLQLRKAIEDDSLLLYGQPIYEFGNDELAGFEVLVRMRGAGGELVTPQHFLPIAERFHATEDLDAWVVRRALLRLSRCPHEGGPPPRLFINLSPTSITSSGFAERIEGIVADSEVPADRLCFEITENGTMKSFDVAVHFLERMRALGALVALDDFGVGLSSLSHLHRLPVDVLKIDGSLVREIDASDVSSTMVATIQALAESLGKVTIAEFVESAAAADALHQLGVHCGQGFHLGRPEPLCDQLASVGFPPVD